MELEAEADSLKWALGKEARQSGASNCGGPCVEGAEDGAGVGERAKERKTERQRQREREAKSRTMPYNAVATCDHLILFK